MASSKKAIHKVSPSETVERTAQIELIAADLNQKHKNLGDVGLELAFGCAEASSKLLQDGRKLLMAKLDFSKGEFSKHVSIGSKKSFREAQVRKALPAGYSVLYSIAQLSDHEIPKLVRDGKIHPRMTRKEADKLRPRKTSEPVEPKCPKQFHVAVQLNPSIIEKDLKDFRSWLEAGRKLKAVFNIVDQISKLSAVQPTSTTLNLSKAA